MAIPTIVFAPYELLKGKNARVYDLPLFLDSEEAMKYIQKNNRKLNKRKIQWIEHWDTPTINEYIGQQGKRQ